MSKGYPIYLIILFVFAALFRCKEVQTESSHNPFFLDEPEIVEFPLDSLTSTTTTCVQLYHDVSTNKEYIALFNMYNNSIYVYNVENRELEFTIPFLESEGMDQIEGFRIYDFNKIAVVKQYLMFLTDKSGVPYYRIDTHDVAGSQGIITGILRATSSHPIIFIDDTNLFINIAPDINDNNLDKIRTTNLGYIINTSNNTIIDVLPPLSKFSEDYYSFYLTFKYNVVFDPVEMKWLVNFAGSHNIQETSNFLNLSDYYAGTTRFGDFIPFNKADLESFLPREKHFRSMISYGKLIHDKYRDVYYRIIHAPISEEDFKRNNWKKKPGVIVLDKDLNKIDEIDVDYNVSIEHIEVGKLGLYFLWYENKEEDKMKFLVFKPSNT